MVYIDLRYSFSVAKNSGKFNGGNNYAQNILKQLCDSYTDIIVICSDELVKKYLVETFKINKEKIFVVTNLLDIDFESKSVYFNPQAQDSSCYVRELKELKKKNPNVKIKLTIHDRRHHEDIIDRYNGLLNEGIKNNFIILGLGRFINSIKKDKLVKQLLEISDEIFTVSNYSMQELIRLGNPMDISYYTQGINFDSNIVCQSENYILFVSAGRSEKNFIRALKAFEEYVYKTGDLSTKLKATGLSDKQKKILKSKNVVNRSFFDNQIELLGYLDKDDFAKIYAKSRFLLFTSKSEGYGLPVSEAMFFEKPVVASRKTSIPEVLGSAALYVNPYSVVSIANGIEKMMDELIYSKQVEYVKEKKDIWKRQVKLDNKIMIERIIK